MGPNLSVVILTKNEEENIRECLESVKWANEIVVVDDCSQDKTVAISREYTDNIHERKLIDFGAQRQFAMDRASGEWILFLDADERIPEALQKEILEAIEPPAPYDGFFIGKKVFFLGKEIKYCGWSFPVLKLFKKEKAKCDLKKVHESILVCGKIGRLNNVYLHYSYKSISQYVLKMDRYSDLDVLELFQQGLKITPANIIWYWFFKPMIAFLRKFILKRGFLDAREGFLISVFTGFVVFLHYTKVWELQRKGHARKS